MSKIWMGLVGLLIVGAVDAAQAKDEEKQIRKVVENHFKGVISADIELLKEAWDLPNAHLKFVQKNSKGREEIRVEKMEDAVKRWTQTKSPQSKGKILSVQVAGDRMAVVEIEFVWKTDKVTENLSEFLTLFKVNGTWKIVNKTYVDKAGPRKSGGGGYGK